jgi:hypothetical protein
MTTTRLDRVIRSQRNLMVANLAAIVVFASSAAASILSLV